MSQKIAIRGWVAAGKLAVTIYRINATLYEQGSEVGSGRIIYNVCLN